MAEFLPYCEMVAFFCLNRDSAGFCFLVGSGAKLCLRAGVSEGQSDRAKVVRAYSHPDTAKATSLPVWAALWSGAALLSLKSAWNYSVIVMQRLRTGLMVRISYGRQRRLQAVL